MSAPSKQSLLGNLSIPFDEMTKAERVRAAVNGGAVDRPPVCFWHHFHPEGSGRRLAEATLDFFENSFDLDILKIMPDIRYPFPRKSIENVDHWRLIEPIDRDRSRFFRQRAEAVRVLREDSGFDRLRLLSRSSVPLRSTLFLRRSRDILPPRA